MVHAAGVCIPAEDVGQHTGVMMDVDQHGLPLETREENITHTANLANMYLVCVCVCGSYHSREG